MLAFSSSECRWFFLPEILRLIVLVLVFVENVIQFRVYTLHNIYNLTWKRLLTNVNVNVNLVREHKLRMKKHDLVALNSFLKMDCSKFAM